MVEYTYQDYLKYEKYLQNEKQKRRHLTDKEIKKLAELLSKLEERQNVNEEMGVMEESVPYEIQSLEDETAVQLTKEQVKESRKKHDELFRSLLNDKENFVDFIKTFISSEVPIKSDDIEKYNRNFVTKKFQSRASDIVYKANGKNVFYLVEHQSSVDYSMPSRMLEYSYEVMRDAVDKIKSKKSVELKVVPIVLYTGNRKWKVPKIIGQMDDAWFRDYGLSLKYILIDANAYSKQDLLQSKSMVACAMQAEKSNSDDEIIEAIERMFMIKPDKIDEIFGIIDYVYSGAINKKDFDVVKKQTKMSTKEVKNTMVTIREKVMKNNQKLMNEARKQGLSQGLIKVTKQLIEMGLEEKDIQRATGLSKQEIAKLKEA